MKNKIKVYIIAIFFAALLIVGGTFAFWSFTSNDKSIVFNTASNLRKYINYDSGESHFSGTLVVGENYSYGIHSTISVSKSEEARNITLMGTIYMDINEIGENMRNSSALKWALTSGDSTNVGALLAEGNFLGAPVGDSLILLPSFEVTTTVQKFTVWIWLDESEHPSEALSGETLDTNVWVEINQVEGTTEDFIVTQINANYQIITATAVNNRHNIDGYKVTTSAEEPSSWEPVASPSRIYNIPEYSDTQVGTTYYVWFKDTEGHTAREPIEITQSDTTRPSCTWGTFNPNSIGNGDTATISLTCTDSGSGIVNSNITTSNITTTNEKIQVTNISKEATTGGYIYTITVTGISNVDGIDNLTLAADSVKDGAKNGNSSESSGNITISNVSVITINAGNGISSITGTGLTYDSNTRKATGTFNNGSTINLSTLTITYKTGYSGVSYTKTSGEGTLSGTTFTVGTGDGALTINSTTLAEPSCNLRITSPFTAIYNNSDGLIQAPANSNNYDSGVNVTFQFGYASNSTDALGNFVESDINSYTVSKTLYRGTRYYGAKVTATGDGGLTATCTTPSGSYREITYVNARIDFDSSADGGTITGTSPLYVGYGDANLYTGRTNTTAGTIPTATPSTGYVFDGWYTAASGGTKVINANGTLVASVSGWTDSSSKWILTSTSDTENTNKLYAQFSPQSYTVTFDPDDGTVSPTTKSVVYDSQYGSLPTPTKTGYSFLGWNGKNLFDEETILMAIPGATYTDNHYVYGIINAKNKYGGSNSLPIQGFKSSTRYTYSIYGYVDGGRETFYFTYAEGGQSYGNFQTNEEKMITIRSNANKTISKLTLSYGNDDNGVSASGKYAHVTHIQLEEGTTVTPFEPYYVLSTTNVTQAKDHTLTAKWSPNTYTITLDNQSATTAGTSTIYEKYDNGVCLNSNCSTVMTTSTNGITVPTKTGYTFDGYYDGTTQMIDADGHITAAFTNTKYSSDKTLTAKWIGNTYTATFYYQSNTTSGSTKVSSTTVSCTVSNTAGNCDITIPSAVKSSVGTYNNAYAGLSESTGNMTEAVAPSDTTITLSTSKTYYGIYRTAVTVYEPTSTSTVAAATYYRNQWFTSDSALATTVLSDSQTGTSNWEFVSNVSSYPVLGGYNINKANSTTVNVSTVAELAATNKTTAYQILRGNIITATYYYNSSTAGDGTIEISTATAESRKRLYCKSTTTAATGNSTFTIPAVVTSSKGPYGQGYLGTANGVNKIAHYNNTASSTYYTYYQSEVANNYYNGSEYADRTLYRTSVFTSKTAMKTVLSTTNTGVNNYTGETGPGGSVWAGLSTAQDTTAEYATVAAAAASTSASLYTIYQFNVSYLAGTNVSAVGEATGNCKVTTSDTSCTVTLPTITPSTGYSSVGWSTTNGATTGTAAGGSYTLDANDITLYANAISNTYTISLDNQSATTAGTGAIYEKYNNGVCLDNNCSTIMTTSTNGITVPTKTGYTFGGYYDDVTEMIANSGFITSEFTNTKYSSNKTLTARWIDDIAPTGNVNASLNGNDIVATVTASDDGSGASSTYGWKISTSSTCGPTVSDFIDSTNASYSFTPTSSGTWYVCVRIEDNAGNKAYLSTSIEKTGITASSISYTGTWGGVQDEGDDNWYAVITGDGTLTFTSSGEIEVFMVGGGGAGGTGIKGVSYTGYSDPGLGGGGGGGGYRTTDTITVSSGTNYSVVIGAGGTKASGSTAASSGGTTSIKNGSTTLLSANGGNAGGNGSGTTPGAGGIGGSNGGKGAKINDSTSYTSSDAGSDGEYAFGSSYYGNKYGAGGGGGGAKSGNNINAWYQTYNSGRSAPSGDYGGPNDGGYGGTPNAAGKDGNYYGAAGGGGGSGSSYTVGGNGYQGVLIIRNVRDGSSSGGSSSSSSSGSTGLYTRVVTECYKEVYGSSTNGNYSNLSSCSSSCNSLNGGACYPNQNAGYTCYYCPAGGVLDGSLKCYYYYTSSTSSLVSSCTPATNFNQCTGTAGTQNAVNITCTPQ